MNFHRSDKSVIWLIITAAALGLAIAVGLWLYLSVNQSSKIRRVILISIDTCRADYLGCYGYHADTTPNLDALAAQGTLFELAVAPAPLTLPSHASMLTAMLPPEHGTRANVGYRLGDFNLTLAEVLKDHGFRTVGVVSSSVLGAKFGIAQGFDEFHDTFTGQGIWSTERRAQPTTDIALNAIKQNANEKFFMFLHYFDPHEEYEPPDEWASRWPDNLYAGEIAYVDHQIGRIIAHLKELNLYDSTLLIVTADHGESFGEHGEYTHGYFIYDTTIRVPLICRMPGSAQGIRVKEHVGLTDIMPTILSCVGIDQPLKGRGTDLSPCFSGKTLQPSPRPYYCESMIPTTLACEPLLGLVRDNWKYIETVKPELYDLQNDPAEQNNLISTHSDRAQKMKRQLNSLLAQAILPATLNQSTATDQQRLENLRGLGYLGAASTPDATESADDAKDYVNLFNKTVQMLLANSKKQNEKVKSLCTEILNQRPGLGIIHNVLGSVLRDQGNTEEALENFRAALDCPHSSPSDRLVFLLNLANLLLRDQQFESAAARYRQAVDLNPDCAEAHFQMGNYLSQTGNPTAALEHFRKVIQLQPNVAPAHFQLALILEKLGDTPAALTAAQQAHQLAIQSNQHDLAQTIQQKINLLNTTARF